MSIIIAKIENKNCYFISDTKVSIDTADKSVTGDSKIRLAPEQGVLKIHILTNRICVAFAGNVELCTSIIHSFIKNSPRTLDGILNYFKDNLEDNDDNSAFIIGLMFDNNIPNLYKITKGEIEEGKSFWIGEPKAFSEFQEIFVPDNSDNSIVNKTSQAFTRLVESTSVNTIGDFIISAYYNHEGQSFFYEERLQSYSGYRHIHVEKDKPQTLDEGTVYEGAFTVTNLISNRSIKPAIAIYFTKGQLGFLYFPISTSNKEIRPQIITNVTKEELTELVLREYGIQLIGFNLLNGEIKFK